MGRPARKVLHTIRIANDASGDAKTGNYVYEIWSGIQRVRSGVIRGFPRQRKNGAQLLQLVLNDAYPATPVDTSVTKEESNEVPNGSGR